MISNYNIILFDYYRVGQFNSMDHTDIKVNANGRQLLTI